MTIGDSYKALFAERNQRILTMHANGMRAGEIAEAFGLTRNRVWQILAELTGVKRGRGRPSGARNEASS